MTYSITNVDTNSDTHINKSYWTFYKKIIIKNIYKKER